MRWPTQWCSTCMNTCPSAPKTSGRRAPGQGLNDTLWVMPESPWVDTLHTRDDPFCHVLKSLLFRLMFSFPLALNASFSLFCHTVNQLLDRLPFVHPSWWEGSIHFRVLFNKSATWDAQGTPSWAEEQKDNRYKCKTNLGVMLPTLLLTPCRRLALPAHTAPEPARHWAWCSPRGLWHSAGLGRISRYSGIRDLSRAHLVWNPSPDFADFQRTLAWKWWDVFICQKDNSSRARMTTKKSKKETQDKTNKNPTPNKPGFMDRLPGNVQGSCTLWFPTVSPQHLPDFLSNRVQTFGHIQTRCKTFSGTRARAAKSCCLGAALQAQPDSHLEPHTSHSSAQTHRGFMGFFRQD